MPFDHAYNAGKVHYRKHGEKLRNPFPAGSAEYNSFERGWAQALKSDSSNASKNSLRIFNREQSKFHHQTGHLTKEEIEHKKQVDDYKKKSGR